MWGDRGKYDYAERRKRRKSRGGSEREMERSRERWRERLYIICSVHFDSDELGFPSIKLIGYRRKFCSDVHVDVLCVFVCV